MTTTMERANKVTVNITEQGFEAKFFKTHKHVATVQSADTIFPINPQINKSAQRELFRLWICENASIYGVNWKPEDMRQDGNKMPNKYDSDQLLMTTAVNLVKGDILEWADKKKEQIQVTDIQADHIVPVTDHKGKLVSSKYGNGNWAYATVHIIVTVRNLQDDEEYYVTIACSLVSGQLKKPSNIGDGGYTMTGFFTELAKDIPSLTAKKEEVPATDEVANEEVIEEVAETEKPVEKKSRKAKKVAEPVEA